MNYDGKINLVKNGFMFLVNNILDNNITEQDLPYFVETLIFSLTENDLKKIGEKILI